MDMLQQTLFDEICKMPVIDTHEHLPWDEAERIKDESDVLGEYLIHYLKSDIISAGLSPDDYEKVIDVRRNVAERWSIVEPFWEYSRHTGYGRALDISVKAIYGIDGVNAGTIETLNAAFLAHKAPGYYQRVLRDLCNIELCLDDCWELPATAEHPLFKFVWQPTDFINPGYNEGEGFLTYLEDKYRRLPPCLDDWLETLAAELDYVLARQQIRVIKNAIAYNRSLRFENVAYGRAKTLFVEALAARGRGAEENRLFFPPELEDFLMHSLLKLANERNLTLQIHTGILEGNGNTLAHSDPSLLNNLFLAYPDVNFDLFHIGYPYQGVACALAKMFPNVFIDMCWAHIISPAASVAALDDFLDAVPYNKISAFGGDYCFVDGVYGHLHISRQNVSTVLAKKVRAGVFDEGRALEIARALYYDNPRRIFTKS